MLGDVLVTNGATTQPWSKHSFKMVANFLSLSLLFFFLSLSSVLSIFINIFCVRVYIYTHTHTAHHTQQQQVILLGSRFFFFFFAFVDLSGTITTLHASLADSQERTVVRPGWVVRSDVYLALFCFCQTCIYLSLANVQILILILAIHLYYLENIFNLQHCLCYTNNFHHMLATDSFHLIILAPTSSYYYQGLVLFNIT